MRNITVCTHSIINTPDKNRDMYKKLSLFVITLLVMFLVHQNEKELSTGKLFNSICLIMVKIISSLKNSFTAKLYNYVSFVSEEVERAFSHANNLRHGKSKYHIHDDGKKFQL